MTLSPHCPHCIRSEGAELSYSHCCGKPRNQEPRESITSLGLASIPNLGEQDPPTASESDLDNAGQQEPPLALLLAEGLPGHDSCWGHWEVADSSSDAVFMLRLCMCLHSVLLGEDVIRLVYVRSRSVPISFSFSPVSSLHTCSCFPASPPLSPSFFSSSQLPSQNRELYCMDLYFCEWLGGQMVSSAPLSDTSSCPILVSPSNPLSH